MYWGPIFTEEIIKPVQLQEEITSLGMKKFVIKWHANDLKEVIYHFAVTKEKGAIHYNAILIRLWIIFLITNPRGTPRNS